MNLDKDQILQLLRSQGDDDKAQQADQELPGQVDTDRDAGLLSKFGLDPMELVKKLGGGGLGGLLGRLGSATVRSGTESRCRKVPERPVARCLSGSEVDLL